MADVFLEQQASCVSLPAQESVALRAILRTSVQRPLADEPASAGNAHAFKLSAANQVYPASHLKVSNWQTVGYGRPACLHCMCHVGLTKGCAPVLCPHHTCGACALAARMQNICICRSGQLLSPPLTSLWMGTIRASTAWTTTQEVGPQCILQLAIAWPAHGLLQGTCFLPVTMHRCCSCLASSFKAVSGVMLCADTMCSICIHTLVPAWSPMLMYCTRGVHSTALPLQLTLHVLLQATGHT